MFKELKQNARVSLRGKWGDSIIALFAAAGAKAILLISLIVPLVWTNGPLNIGLTHYFYQISENKKPKTGAVFSGFDHYGRNLLMGLLKSVLIFAWSLLLFIPGYMVSLMYGQTSFIAATKPEAKIMAILKESAQLMKGHKTELFLLQLSFIGWFGLSLLTAGVGLLWLIPYYKTTMANYYKSLIKENK
ncbi:MAG: DUF975 family protein [Firmicutes bacterium]|nr:DUF975 family protein [Bacillota bacterium]